MRQAIPEKDRLFVARRAGFRCEYCRIHADDLFLSFHIDHIIPLKHGGTNDTDNLAYTCPHCNQHKGTDFATLDRETGQAVFLYNPRHQIWQDHFSFDGARMKFSKNGATMPTAPTMLS